MIYELSKEEIDRGVEIIKRGRKTMTLLVPVIYTVEYITKFQNSYKFKHPLPPRPCYLEVKLFENTKSYYEEDLRPRIEHLRLVTRDKDGKIQALKWQCHGGSEFLCDGELNLDIHFRDHGLLSTVDAIMEGQKTLNLHSISRYTGSKRTPEWMPTWGDMYFNGNCMGSICDLKTYKSEIIPKRLKGWETDEVFLE